MQLHIQVNRSRLNEGQLQLLDSTDDGVLMAGGFGSGKTTAIALKAIQLKAANGRAPGLIVGPTAKSLWSTTYRRLRATLRATLPVHIADKMLRVHDKQVECFMDWGDGSPIFLRSAHNPDAVDGLDVGWALGDELRYWPEQTFNVFLGRVRVPCVMPQKAFSSTPEIGFMSEEFNSGKQHRRLIIAPTLQNAHNLAPDYIPNLRLSYSPRLQKAVLEGYFTVLEGAVYEALDPDFWNSAWAIDHDPSAARDWKTYLAVDPGFRRSSWLWIHEVTPTSWIVFDQIQGEGLSANACVEMVNARGWPIDEIWCDPAADNTDQATGMDVVSMLRAVKTREQDAVCYITPPFTSITWGVDKVRTSLGDPASGLPRRVRFAKRLEEIERGKKRGIGRSVLNYRYPEARHGRPVVNEPFKDGTLDHDNDALRYFVAGRWLRSPLRELDPLIMKMQQEEQRTGWKRAA